MSTPGASVAASITGSVAGKRIGLLTASVSTLGGGVAEAVLSQAAIIRDMGAVPVIFALRDARTDAQAARFADYETHLASRQGPAIFGYAKDMHKQMMHAECDVMHLHGIWMYPSRAGAVWAQRTGRPYIISPHGMLDPWITARGRWKKALARRFYERSGWRKAAAFHALTSDEAQDIARETGAATIRTIPNPAPAARSHAADFPAPEVIFIGRIHLKKNLAALVAGWGQLSASDAGEARLTIAGWGDGGDVPALEKLVAAAPGNVRYIGPVHGAAKQELLARARFMALPSLSEGLPVAILEAWANGVPTLMSLACHLPQGFSSGAAADCGTQADSIAAALRRALALPPMEWRAMSGAATDLASGPFAASTAAQQWRAVYGALASGKVSA